MHLLEQKKGGKGGMAEVLFEVSLLLLLRQGGTDIMPDMGNQMGKERKEKSTKFSNRRVNFFTKCIGVFQNQNSILENMSKNSSCLSRSNSIPKALQLFSFIAGFEMANALDTLDSQTKPARVPSYTLVFAHKAK